MQTSLNFLYSLRLCAMLLVTLLGTASFAQQESRHAREMEADHYENDFENEEGENPEAEMAASLERMLQEFNMTKDPALNVVPRERLLEARKFAELKWQELLAETAIPGINWTERGPNNVGGRTRAILVDAADATGNTVWAGGVAGGLWKTTNFSNATPTWIKANDFFDNLAVSSIVQDPANSSIIYFGTGEGYFNVDAVRGLGIWKTTNGGTSWSQLASTNNSNFYYVMDLLIDNSGNLYAATHSGVRRSTNGGTSWAQVLGSTVGAGATNSASDLELGADGDVYATLGIFSPGSIFKSDFGTYGANTGALGNWTNITPPTGTYQRIELATAPSDANRVYAVCQGGATNSADYLFRSTNGGTSWTSLTVPGFCDAGNANPVFTRGQAWYDLVIAVDPNDAQKVYMGGVDALRSSDGGNTWTQITGWAQNGFNFCTGQAYVHADHHVIKFINGSSNNAIWGSDGGIAHTTNATAALPTFTDKNIGYNVTQFYACAVHPNAGSNYFLAGAQDNGTNKFTAAGLGNTTAFSGGDGSFCHIDQDNPNIQISAFTHNNYWVSLDGGNTGAFQGFNNEGQFINPTDYDNVQNKLYASDVPGSYLRWDNPSTAGNSFTVVNAGFAGQVTAVTCDPSAANRVWMGDDAGNVYRVNSAHTNTPSVTTFTPPGPSWVSSIYVDPANPNRLMVCRSNYGTNSIYELTISGNTGTWTSFEGNLPDMPVRWGMFNPNNPDQALIATELGVWSTDNINGGTTDWDPTNIGLANTRVDMLQYRPADNLLAAATHGRGLYTATLPLDLYPSCSSLTNPAPGATNVPVTAALTWSAATNGPTGYRLDVGTTVGGTDILNNFDAGNVTTYDPPGDLPGPSPIYVTVKPYNANGSATGCPVKNFTTASGGLSNPSACQLNLPIPDNSCTNANNFPIQVANAPGTQLGTDVVLTDVNLIIAHTWDADLDITLISPNNVAIDLSSDNGGSGDNYGNPADPACASVTNFRMNAPTSITAGAAPFIGSYIPEGNFAAFNDGSNPNGTWTLKVCDDASDDVGMLKFVELKFALKNPTACQLNLPIPDNSCTNAHRFPIQVSNAPGTQLGTDVTLTEANLIIAHTWDADLDITLISPNNVAIDLSSNNGGSGDNFGNPADPACASVTNFRMNAPTPITAGVAPFIGSYIPEGNFAAFNDGSNPNGTWTLQVCDDESGDVGMLKFAELKFGGFVSCTNLTSPANGATNVPANTLLTWAPATGSPTGYRLDVGITPGGTQILNNFDVGNVTTFDPPGYLPYGVTIYVKIKPYNANGQAMGCNEQSFQTGNCIPNLVVVSIPVPAGDYKSLGDLISNNSTIANGTVVNFISNTGVLLDQNFVVEPGGVFEVVLQSCN